MGLLLMIPSLILLLFGLYEAATNPVARERAYGRSTVLFGMVMLFLSMYLVSNP